MRVLYDGKDQEGHTAQNAFIAKVLRDDDEDSLPDRVLSIEPIPDRTVIVGGKVHVPITIRSNLDDDIEIEVSRTWYDKSARPPSIYVTSPEFESASLQQVSGPLHGPNPEDKLYHFAYSSDSWCSDYRKSLFKGHSAVRYAVYVTCGEHWVMANFDLLYFDPKGSDPRINYQFVPVADSTWTEQDNVSIKLQLNKMEEGISFRTGPLPPGLNLDPSISSIYGQFDIRDWQPGETQRRFPITVYALFKADRNKEYELWDKEMVAVTSFYVTVQRQQILPEDADQPRAIPDQTVINQFPILPIHVTCNHPLHTLKITDIKGLPPGSIRFGPGNYIEGKPDITDWGEEESSREFPVTVTTQCKARPTAHPDGVPTVSLPATDEIHFKLKVLNPAAKDVKGGDDGNLNSHLMDLQNIMDSLNRLADGALDSPKDPPKDTPEDTQKDPPEEIPEDTPVDIPEDMPEGDIIIPPPPPPEPPKRLPVKEGLSIAILQSEETGEQNKLLQGALFGLHQAGYAIDKTLSIDFFQLSDKQFDPEPLTQKTYALAITLGQQALATAQEKLASGIPLVVLGVANPALTRPATGVSPAVPSGALLDSIITLHPDAKTIGYLYTDEAGQLDALTTLASELSLSVQSAAAPDAAQYAQAGLKLLEGTDLLILARPAPGEDALNQLLESAAKPVYIPLAEPFGMGKQGGSLAARILSGEDVKALPFEEAHGIILN